MLYRFVLAFGTKTPVRHTCNQKWIFLISWYLLGPSCAKVGLLFFVVLTSSSAPAGRQSSALAVSTQHLQSSGLTVPHRSVQWRSHPHCLQTRLGTQRAQQGKDNILTKVRSSPKVQLAVQTLISEVFGVGVGLASWFLPVVISTIYSFQSN